MLLNEHILIAPHPPRQQNSIHIPNTAVSFTDLEESCLYKLKLNGKEEENHSPGLIYRQEVNRSHGENIT